jgi:uncharacterized protein YijF (DUF1287 family)
MMPLMPARNRCRPLNQRFFSYWRRWALRWPDWTIDTRLTPWLWAVFSFSALKKGDRRKTYAALYQIGVCVHPASPTTIRCLRVFPSKKDSSKLFVIFRLSFVIKI